MAHSTEAISSRKSRNGSVVRSVVALKPQGPRFEPGPTNCVYRTKLADSLWQLMRQ